MAAVNETVNTPDDLENATHGTVVVLHAPDKFVPGPDGLPVAAVMTIQKIGYDWFMVGTEDPFQLDELTSASFPATLVFQL